LLTYVVAGPLVDRIFEPMMSINGPLAGSIGPIIGTGVGRGIGLLFVAMGLLLVLITAISCLYPHLRRVEDDLPDAVTSQPIHAKAESRSLAPLPASD
jgi:DHA3 family macrolide efflux protein-like MFS transporter